MLNYYEILGISKNADQKTIKSAFKKLAFSYHPDKQPNNPAAEEFFKQINEAYQTLSDPEKKRRYDFLLNYSYDQASYTNTTFSERKTYKPRHEEKSVYERYGKFSWKNAPRYKKAPTYRVDKNYYKIQALTFVVMLILSAIIMAGNNYWSHLKSEEKRKVEEQKSLALNAAHDLFNHGDYRGAIEQVVKLGEQHPYDMQFYEERELMVSSIFNTAEQELRKKSYQSAAEKLEIVKEFERPEKMKTWQMLADAYYAIGNYKKSAYALDHILQRDKYNLELVVKIARLYSYELNDKVKALEYYDEAKLLFKEFQSSTYGDAFELVVNPKNLPDYYYDLFIERARLNFEIEKYEEAMTDYNWAIFLKPEIGENYNKRGHCKRLIGLQNRACKDWQRALKRGHAKSKNDLNIYCR